MKPALTTSSPVQVSAVGARNDGGVDCASQGPTERSKLSVSDHTCSCFLPLFKTGISWYAGTANPSASPVRRPQRTPASHSLAHSWNAHSCDTCGDLANIEDRRSGAMLAPVSMYGMHSAVASGPVLGIVCHRAMRRSQTNGRPWDRVDPCTAIPRPTSVLLVEMSQK